MSKFHVFHVYRCRSALILPPNLPPASCFPSSPAFLPRLLPGTPTPAGCLRNWEATAAGHFPPFPCWSPVDVLGKHKVDLKLRNPQAHKQSPSVRLALQEGGGEFRWCLKAPENSLSQGGLS